MTQISRRNFLKASVAAGAAEHFKLVKDEPTATSASHPCVQSAYAMLEVLADRAGQTFRPAPRTYARDALQLLDPVRDADELAALRERL